MKLIFPAMLFLSLVIFSCTTEEDGPEAGPDTTRPLIEAMQLAPPAGPGTVCQTQESAVINVPSGQTLNLSLRFTDDQTLSQYKIDVHNNFDCHSHGRTASEPWQVLLVRDLSGGQKTAEEQLKVPEDAQTGDYHLQILCLDASGNEAEPLLYSVKVVNSLDNTPPQLVLTEPSATAITHSKAQPLVLRGKATDNLGLAAGRIEVTYTDAENVEFFPSQQYFEGSAGKEEVFEIIINLPASAKTGLYEFTVAVFDTYNNSSSVNIQVDITE